MTNVRVKIEGIPAFRKALHEAAKMEAVKKVVRLNGSELQQKAMEYCPVDTGNLKRSIQLSFEDGGNSAVVEPTANYAGYVEYGTRYMENLPFLRPAYFRQTAIFEQDLKKLGLE